MGCCHSADDLPDALPDDQSPLINDDVSRSKADYDKSYHSLPIRPLCKCGAELAAYELQCCYLSDLGSPFTGQINCELCGKCMSASNEIVWHCLGTHKFTYDLCWDCGSKVASKMKNDDQKYDQNNLIDDKYKDIEHKFDPINNKPGIDWNILYNILCNDAKVLKINKIINDNIDVNNLDQYNFTNDVLKFIQKINYSVKMTSSVHNACNDMTGWTIQNDTDNICISYKKEDDAIFHSIKSNFLARCSVLDYIATLNEFDLIGELIQLIKVESKMLKEFTNSDKVIYMKMYSLWPMKHRDYIIHVGACDALEEMDEVILWGSSPKDDKIPGVDIPSEAECNTVRVDIVRLDCCVKPLRFGVKNETDLTRVVMIFNVDFKSYMPQKFVNWVSRTFSYALVKVIRDRCENLKGTKHEQRIKTRDIYRRWRLGLMEWQRNKTKINSKQNTDDNDDKQQNVAQ